MSRQLLIVGAGGFARETAAVVMADPQWAPIGYIDDNPLLHGEVLTGLPVVGPIDAVADYPDAQVVVCTGNPRNWWSRRVLVERLELPADRYATVVHPTASIGVDTTIGAGSVLLAGTVTTTAVSIGAHVAVMPGVIFTHDDVVGDFATFGAGVRLGGGVRIGQGAYVGAGALVRESVHVGDWSQLGMGAVVLHDVPAREVWVGAPARRLRTVDMSMSGAGAR